jgi:hypothetical protein
LTGTEKVDSLSQMPTLLVNLQRFYDALHDAATTDDQGVVVFRGHVTKVFLELRPPLPQPYYAKLRRYLLATECIVQVSRGARYSDSVWHLIQRPTEDLIRDADPDSLVADTSTDTAIKLVQSRVKDIGEQLGGMNVVRAIGELQGQLNALDERITVVEDSLKDNDNKE